MTRKWLWENLGRIVSLCALVAVIGGYAAAIFPMPAKASDLEALAKSTQEKFDTMTSAIQQLAEIQTTATINQEITIKQSEIRTIRRDYPGDVPRDSQITIDMLIDEIDELRWQRDNPQR